MFGREIQGALGSDHPSLEETGLAHLRLEHSVGYPVTPCSLQGRPEPWGRSVLHNLVNACYSRTEAVQKGPLGRGSYFRCRQGIFFQNVGRAAAVSLLTKVQVGHIEASSLMLPRPAIILFGPWLLHAYILEVPVGTMVMGLTINDAVSQL